MKIQAQVLRRVQRILQGQHSRCFIAQAGAGLDLDKIYFFTWVQIQVLLITQYVTPSNLINLQTYGLLSINPRYYRPCQLVMSIIDNVSKMSGKYLALRKRKGLFLFFTFSPVLLCTHSRQTKGYACPFCLGEGVL